MPIAVACSCGKNYNLKDEFAGKQLQCPACGATVLVQATVPDTGYDRVFVRNKFLIRQKHMSISSKYYVWDEGGNNLLFVRRPAHLFRNVMALLASAVTGLGALIMVIFIIGTLADALKLENNTVLVGTLFIAGLLLSLFSAIYVLLLLQKKRHVLFFRDDTESELLMDIHQDKKFYFFNATYTVRDSDEVILATLRKNYLYNTFRKRWYCSYPDGAPWLLIKEDSLILSLLRRFLGSFYGLLRTNFVILDPESEKTLGEFNRKFTLLDRYTLDMSADADYSIDRRVALAIGIMLDTGERR